jgi:hypothetical protein
VGVILYMFMVGPVCSDHGIHRDPRCRRDIECILGRHTHPQEATQALVDLALECGGKDTVSILLGNGDGTFQAAQNFPAGVQPVSLAVRLYRGEGMDEHRDRP